MRDYDPKAEKIFIHRLKGSNSGEHHLVREEARALRAWLKVRGSFPGPIFLSTQKRPIDRTTLHLLMNLKAAVSRLSATRSLCIQALAKTRVVTRMVNCAAVGNPCGPGAWLPGARSTVVSRFIHPELVGLSNRLLCFCSDRQ